MHLEARRASCCSGSLFLAQPHVLHCSHESSAQAQAQAQALPPLPVPALHEKS